jgi:hypothetical protein
MTEMMTGGKLDHGLGKESLSAGGHSSGQELAGNPLDLADYACWRSKL